jgi:putative zinc finger/helix-turn-helix YgiT family protein
MNCEKCSKAKMLRHRATDERPYRFVESGLDNVFLVGINIHSCKQCNEEVPEIPNLSQLHDIIAEGLVAKPVTLTGAEIRFLRKNLGLKAGELAKALDTTDVSVSRWETGEQDVSKENDKLIRYFYLRAKEERSKHRIQRELVQQLSDVEHQQRPLNMNVDVPHKTAEFVEVN